jgi:tetratricopeptide (TPR) repeat protein
MNISSSLSLAIQHYNAGNFVESERICKNILSERPEQFDVLHLLGVISLEQGNFDAAINYFEKAIKLKETNPYAYFNLGNVYAKKGDVDQAILCYEKAVRLNPQFADAYHNLAFLLQKKGCFDEAIDNYKMSLKLNPELIDAYYNIGTILQDRKQLDEAEAYYKMALRHDPAYVDSYYNLAGIYRDKEQFDDAVKYYQRALQFNTNLFDANLNLGVILGKKGDVDNAITYYQKAMQLNPNQIGIHNAIGSILREKGMLDEAIRHFRKELLIHPDNADAFCNMGNVLHEKRQMDEAISYYKKAMELNPEHIDAHWGFALTLLLQRDFPQGLREFEWRLKIHQLILKRHVYSEPMWNGSDISGKRILLISEQGIGDTIQFIRYVPLVAQRGAKIVVQCHKELTSLIRGMDNIEAVVSHDEHIEGFDTYCYLLSLPHIFNTIPETIPVRIPYVTADPVLRDKWKERFSDDDGKIRVGLVWSSNPKNTMLHYKKSFSLHTFSPLTNFNGVTFYSLQKGEAAAEVKNPPVGMKLVDYTEEISDFSDTSALIENLDLVISVDTAVAHLAGAMGKRVWTLLPFVPDWRWMLDREDSPWYPTMRLFRQPSGGDWAAVIAQVRDELLKLLGGGN